MTDDDFYKLSYEDMVDCLIKIKLKYNLKGLSKPKIIDIAELFSSGYRVKQLQPYIFSINERETKQALVEDGIARTKARQLLASDEFYTNALWEETEKIMQERKEKRKIPPTDNEIDAVVRAQSNICLARCKDLKPNCMDEALNNNCQTINCCSYVRNYLTKVMGEEWVKEHLL